MFEKHSLLYYTKEMHKHYPLDLFINDLLLFAESSMLIFICLHVCLYEVHNISVVAEFNNKCPIFISMWVIV